MKGHVPDPIISCPILQQCCGAGKQKIANKHRSRLADSIKQSIDFEEVADLWQANPELARWDYLVKGHRPGWSAVEVHQARASDLVRKKKGSQTILQRYCPSMLDSIRCWHVCVEGEIHPSQRRLLADAHIQISRNFMDSA
jgi:hypothetical protein